LTRTILRTHFTKKRENLLKILSYHYTMLM